MIKITKETNFSQTRLPAGLIVDEKTLHPRLVEMLFWFKRAVWVEPQKDKKK